VVRSGGDFSWDGRRNGRGSVFRWVHTLRGLRAVPQLDIDAVCASAPLGSVDFEVGELSWRVTRDDIVYLATEPLGLLDEIAPVATEPLGLLDANVIVIVEWSKQRHVHLFDGLGRYIAIVPTHDGWFWPNPTFHFMEAGGVVFSIHPVPANMTTVHGKPFGIVTAETNGKVIGTFGQDRDSHGVGFRGYAGELLGTGSSVVRSPDGQVLARMWSTTKGKTPTRRYWRAGVVRFNRDATTEIRALTLGYELCEGMRSS